MTRLPELDFAIDRGARRRWQKLALVALGMAGAAQIGVAAWRAQTLAEHSATLAAQQSRLAGQNARAQHKDLTPEQLKALVGAKAMLDSLGVPWETLLAALEAARTPRIVIDTVRPRTEDASVAISVSCSDFAAVAEFVRRLAQQDALAEVMLVSEALPENGVGPLRAVISANWRKVP